MSSSPFISLKEVDITYGSQPVLNRVTITISRGEKIGVVGPNGSGKTTLIKTIMGAHKEYRGSVLKDPLIRFGYAPQRAATDLLVPLSVYEYITLNLAKSSEYDEVMIKTWGEKLNINHLIDKKFVNLSGGQKQKVVLLRALIELPDCLVLDEPTDNLDIKGEREILRIVDDFCMQHSATLILISHSLSNVINHVNRLIILGELSLSEVRFNTENDLEESLSKLFGVALSVKKVNSKKIIV